jgi:MFS family permease
MEKSASSNKSASIHLTGDTHPSSQSSQMAAGAEAAGFDNAATKKLVRKIDLKLLPLLTILYLLSFLDRTNIGNARLDTFEADLGMTGLMYNNALAIFFPFYVIAEIPSNIAMKRLPPWLWIPLIMMIWGVCCTLMGIVHNYEGILATRSVLGLAEGGLFPGIAY